MTTKNQSTTNTLNFEPLKTPVTSADLAELAKTDPEAKSRHAVPAVRFLTIVVLTAALANLLAYILHFGTPLAIGFVIVAAACAGITVVANGKRRANHASIENIRLRRFATANSLPFLSMTAAKSYGGLIFKQGSYHAITQALLFPGQAEIGNLRFSVGAGFYSGNFNYGYIRLKLTSQFPQMVLDAKANNLLRKQSNLLETFSKSQAVRLDGGLNEHFTLYAPEGSEADVRRVFTPEVATALLSLGKNYDVEIIGDELFVYHEGAFTLSDETTLRNLLQFAGQVGGELLDHTARYDEDRDTSVDQQAAHLKPVAISGVLIIFALLFATALIVDILFLKSGLALLAFLAVFIVYLFAVSRIHKQ